MTPVLSRQSLPGKDGPSGFGATQESNYYLVTARCSPARAACCTSVFSTGPTTDLSALPTSARQAGVAPGLTRGSPFLRFFRLYSFCLSVINQPRSKRFRFPSRNPGICRTYDQSILLGIFLVPRLAHRLAV